MTRDLIHTPSCEPIVFTKCVWIGIKCVVTMDNPGREYTTLKYGLTPQEHRPHDFLGRRLLRVVELLSTRLADSERFSLTVGATKSIRVQGHLLDRIARR
jgi:hypothetical protein